MVDERQQRLKESVQEDDGSPSLWGRKAFINRLHRVEETWMTYSSDQRVVGQDGGKQKDERREENSADEELIDRVRC